MSPETEGTFAEAITKLRAGYKMRRTSWLAGTFLLPTVVSNGITAETVGIGQIYAEGNAPWEVVTMFWLPTLNDLLATDWIVVTDPSYNSETPVLDPP